MGKENSRKHELNIKNEGPMKTDSTNYIETIKNLISYEDFIKKLYSVSKDIDNDSYPNDYDKNYILYDINVSATTT